MCRGGIVTVLLYSSPVSFNCFITVVYCNFYNTNYVAHGVPYLINLRQNGGV